MTDKEKAIFIPPSENDISLIQPNNVTFGQYNISEWQENLLTLISDKIQDSMTKEQKLPRDLFNQPYVEIYCDDAGGKNNKSKVLKEAIDMIEKKFSFRWKHPNIHQDIETNGTIITTVHNLKGTNRIIINLNPWSLPFLVYYGVGVGGTIYNKALALTLRGNYTKRLYKIICSQRDREEYYYNLSQFRKDLEIPDIYTNAQIEQKILKPAKERIKKSDSDVWFDYKMICKTPQKGRKPKADTIILQIHSKNPVAAGGQQSEKYSFVYRWLTAAFNYPNNDKVVKTINKIMETGRFNDIYDRLCYYDDELCNGKKDKEHIKNSILKILREDFNIK